MRQFCTACIALWTARERDGSMSNDINVHSSNTTAYMAQHSTATPRATTHLEQREKNRHIHIDIGSLCLCVLRAW